MRHPAEHASLNVYLLVVAGMTLVALAFSLGVAADRINFLEHRVAIMESYHHDQAELIANMQRSIACSNNPISYMCSRRPSG